MSRMQAFTDFEENEVIPKEEVDTIVEELIEEVSYDEEGNKITKYKKNRENVTKKMQETMLSLNIENIESVIEKARKEIEK